MPLYRQAKDWANQGVKLSGATLANWIIRPSHEWLEPMYDAIKKNLKDAISGSLSIDS